MRKTIAFSVILALSAPACGSTSTDQQDPLVVYSGRSEELVQPLIDMFSEQTGATVEVRYGESPELAATLLAEGASTNADVFFAQDPASLGVVAPMFATIPEATLQAVDSRFRDREGRWVGTSGRVRTFVYNTAEDMTLPETVDEVNGPQWAGRLGVAPTNGSFLAFVAAMILERGEAATLAWLRELAANDPVDYPDNSSIVAATDAGEIAGGLVNHYYLLRRRAEGAGANAENWFIPGGDVSTLLMPAGVGIMKASKRQGLARQFVDFLLQPAAQAYFAEETFEYPLIAEVSQAEGLPALSELETPDIDLSELAGVLEKATVLVAEAGLV